MPKFIKAESLHRMQSVRTGEVDKAFTERAKQKRDAVSAANGSCLTCSHTGTQCGIFLICSLKNKKVREYNYCENWKSPLGKESENA